MDFITHSLMGSGAARLATREPDRLPQMSMAALLGALLPDADPWLYLIDPAWYGFYHRVVSHSLIGLVVISLLCAGIVRLFHRIRRWRRFGWFVSPNPPPGASPPAVPFLLLWAVALMAGLLHFVFDTITGFGNMLPLWPWSHWDASLKIVTSFDPVIAGSTLLWFLVMRWREWPRRIEWRWTAAYAALLIIYLLLRARFGQPTWI
jgi:membrane-bound metal-dependent hydrolase YbcI (DUF457 family)